MKGVISGYQHVALAFPQSRGIIKVQRAYKANLSTKNLYGETFLFSNLFTLKQVANIRARESW